jgi:hypothetical protein
MTATDRQQAPGVRTDVDAAFRGSATYRSLGEQQLSPAEERFERGRRTVGLFLAPAVTVVFALLPLDLPRDQHLLAAVLLGVIVLWITEPVPIPIGGLIGVGAIAVLGVVPADDAVGPLGSTTAFTFIGAFILAAAMLKHGVARRFAMAILSMRWVGGSTARHPRVRPDHVPAVGVRLHHRHGRDAAAHGDRHPLGDRQADAGQGDGRAGLRPAAAPGGRRADAHAGLRGERRR